MKIKNMQHCSYLGCPLVNKHQDTAFNKVRSFLRRLLLDPHFFQNCGHQLTLKQSSIENYHNFERNEDRATVFLK